jgi:hypothetical protein
MPAHGARNPTQVTAVPENWNVALAPADLWKDAVFSLHARLRLPWNQAWLFDPGV